MALHGSIKVNHHEIGWWEAVCQSDVPFELRRTQPDAVATYLCTLRLNDQQWVGTVEHRYGDGAVALLGKLLAAATAARETL